MKVWIENPFDNLPPEGFRPQRYWMMASAFAAAGHEVVYWTSAFSHAKKAPRKLQQDFFGYGFALRTVPTPPYDANVSLARLRSHRAYARNWLRLAREEIAGSGAPELLVVSAPPLSTGAVALHLKRRYGCRLVTDVQDAWPETFRRLLPRGFRWLAPLVFLPLARAARRLYRGSDRVTGVCDAYAELLRKYGVDRYSRTYLGIRLSSCASRPSGDDVSFHLVYAGNLGRSYDLETALRAVARLEFVRFTVAGEGERIDALRELVRRLGIGSRVEFAGYLSEGALAKLLLNADAGLVPMERSSCVGIPNKFADYANASLAIVSSLEGESAALLERYSAGLLYRAGDAAGLAGAIIAAREELPIYRHGSRRLAEAEFDADRLYREYVDGVVGDGDK